MLAIILVVVMALAHLSPGMSASISDKQPQENYPKSQTPCSSLDCALKCLTEDSGLGLCTSPCGKCKSGSSSGESKCSCLGKKTKPTSEPTNIEAALKCLTGDSSSGLCPSPCGKCKSSSFLGGSKCSCFGKNQKSTDEPTTTSSADETEKPSTEDESENPETNPENSIDETEKAHQAKNTRADKGKKRPHSGLRRRITETTVAETEKTTGPTVEEELLLLGEEEFEKLFSKLIN